MLRLLSRTSHGTSVEVLGADGMMRYARVVDLADDGLFVDMLCPNRRREHVPYNSVFRLNNTPVDKYNVHYNGYRSALSVEVQVPETPLGPWIWLSGETDRFERHAAHEQYAGSVVHWRRKEDGVLCSDFVPIGRLRIPVDKTLLLRRMMRNKRSADDDDAVPSDHIRPGTFVQRTVKLDDEFSYISAHKAEALVKRLNSCEYVAELSSGSGYANGIHFLDLVHGQLRYVSQEKTKLTLWYLFSILTDIWPRESATITEELALPGELWLEVFSSLDTVTQTKLRAVCAVWNALLNAPALRRRILVGDYDDKSWEFLNLATLYKCLHPGTRHIAIDARNRQMNMGDMMELCDMIRYVADQRTRIRLLTLQLSKLTFPLQIGHVVNGTVAGDCRQHPRDPSDTWTDPEYSCGRLSHFIAVCSSLPCDTVVMTNCVMSWDYWVLVWMEIPLTRLPVNQFRCALCDALDAVMPVPSAMKVQALNDQKLYRLPYRCNKEILCATQSADPRPSAHFRGKKWCVDGLRDLQLEKLSRISLNFLVELVGNKRIWFAD
ncbi:uncharacterized protein LOC129589450 [Paramacrobiotus metropolitanus]|uniref:uncharacterized protein LOC129589450 n=1 Tax=Paramacrobiotus metropolitanus TaxID=2943436 RepID=UPI00244652F9|nr:uncharacterized protein LOC129589450 [Paramacrobiotus metropolitanus]XP_055340199.1 uncharacterized protein LOC129589450 [Paramacrobiotus metropolitanus]